MDILSKAIRIQDVGIKLNDTDIQRLEKRLKDIASLNYDKAYARYLTPKNEQGWIKITEEWNKDQKAILIAMGFLSDKHSFLPLKTITVKNRLQRFSPLSFVSAKNDPTQEKLLKDVISIAAKLLQAINDAEKFVQRSDFQAEFNYGGFHVVNKAALSASELKFFTDLLDSAASILPHKFMYGTVWITSTKDLPKGRTLAYYMHSTDTVALLYDRKSADKDPLYSLIHELGHRAWHRFVRSEDHIKTINMFNDAFGSKITQPDLLKFSVSMYEKSDPPKMNLILRFIEKNPDLLKIIKANAEKVQNHYDRWSKELDEYLKQQNIEHRQDKLEKDVKNIMQRSFLKVSFSSFLKELGVNDQAKLREILTVLATFANDWNLTSYSIVDVNGQTSLMNDKLEEESKNIFPTYYSREDINEFFAECFACYYTKKKPVNPIMAEIVERT